jgi:arylformamidase
MANSVTALSNPLAERYAKRCLELGRLTNSRRACVLDIPYGDEPRQRLDLYRPDVAQARLPVLIFFHGGGFADGAKEWGGFMAEAVIDTPAIFISAGYRLTPAAELREIVADAAAVVSWTSDNVAAYGGSPEGIFVGGHSAGGAIAATIAVRRQLLLEAGVAEHSIKGAVCLSTSFHSYAVAGTKAAAYTLPSGPLQVSDGAPLALVDGARPPFLIAWGGGERQVERVERSSMAMIGALRDRNVEVEWLFLPEADHFDTHLAFANPDHPWARSLRGWLGRNFR